MKFGHLKGPATLLLAAISSGCVAQPPSMQGYSGKPGGYGKAESPGHAPVIVTDFSTLVLRNGPAVVNISTTTPKPTAETRRLWPPAGRNDDPFSRFFEQFSSATPGFTGDPSQNLGSGFIVNASGYILTASQVITGAAKVKVTLNDGRKFKATVVGNDPASGIAVLKVPATNLPTLKIGSVASEKAGNWVASIGNPDGMSDTVTAGIISNMARELPRSSYIPLIQTDMTEGAGDAGSPVLDPGGHVIGMETPVMRSFGGVDGLAFAIPIDEAMKVEQQLQQHHQAQHGRLGITVQDVSAPLAQAFGMTKTKGALVSFVNPGGPAARAGLHSGDVILQIDGAATDSTRLPMIVADLKPGTTVQLVYWRDNAAHNASIVLGKRGNGAQSSTASARATASDGLTVRGLTAEEQHDAGVKGGVRVVESAGPAAFAGIEAGDIILMVDNKPISSPMQFRDKVDSSGRSLALLVERNGERMFVTMDTG